MCLVVFFCVRTDTFCVQKLAATRRRLHVILMILVLVEKTKEESSLLTTATYFNYTCIIIVSVCFQRLKNDSLYRRIFLNLVLENLEHSDTFRSHVSIVIINIDSDRMKPKTDVTPSINVRLSIKCFS